MKISKNYFANNIIFAMMYLKDICKRIFCIYTQKGGENMGLENKFISYQELTDLVGCSYQQIQKVHSKKIIEIFNIDISRLPKKGVLPRVL